MALLEAEKQSYYFYIRGKLYETSTSRIKKTNDSTRIGNEMT